MTATKSSRTPLSSALSQRKRILASAMASMRIEGLVLDTPATSDFDALQAGALSNAELRERLLERYTRRASTN